MVLGGGFAGRVEVELVDSWGMVARTGAAGGHGYCSWSLGVRNGARCRGDRSRHRAGSPCNLLRIGLMIWVQRRTYFQPCCNFTTAKPKSPNQRKKTITLIKAQSRQKKRAQEWQKPAWRRTMLRKSEDFAHRKF